MICPKCHLPCEAYLPDVDSRKYPWLLSLCCNAIVKGVEEREEPEDPSPDLVDGGLQSV